MENLAEKEEHESPKEKQENPKNPKDPEDPENLKPRKGNKIQKRKFYPLFINFELSFFIFKLL